MPSRFPRRRVLQLAAGAFVGGAVGAALTSCRAPPAENVMMKAPPGRMPVVFVGHGSPMNAIEDNAFSRAFRALGDALPKPRAIVAVSAHWYTRNTLVMMNAQPKTIHDFGGFPQALFEVQYPAPGEPKLAQRLLQLLREVPAQPSSEWGLDHGTWSVLRHIAPAADVPVVQLSIDAAAPAARHVALGRALQPLRDEGVMVFCSGNITHNLRAYFQAARAGDSSTPAWATAFDTDIAQALTQHDDAFLAAALDKPEMRQVHPTPDHYLPLLYAAGAATAADAVAFPIVAMDASLSMRAVRFG